MLQRDAQIATVCGDCDEPMSLNVVDGKLVEDEGVVHFAVPAKLWWEDVVFT